MQHSSAQPNSSVVLGWAGSRFIERSSFQPTMLVDLDWVGFEYIERSPTQLTLSVGLDWTGLSPKLVGMWRALVSPTHLQL